MKKSIKNDIPSKPVVRLRDNSFGKVSFALVAVIILLLSSITSAYLYYISDLHNRGVVESSGNPDVSSKITTHQTTNLKNLAGQSVRKVFEQRDTFEDLALSEIGEKGEVYFDEYITEIYPQTTDDGLNITVEDYSYSVSLESVDYSTTNFLGMKVDFDTPLYLKTMGNVHLKVSKVDSHEIVDHVEIDLEKNVPIYYPFVMNEFANLENDFSFEGLIPRITRYILNLSLQEEDGYGEYNFPINKKVVEEAMKISIDIVDALKFHKTSNIDLSYFIDMIVIEKADFDPYEFWCHQRTELTYPFEGTKDKDRLSLDISDYNSSYHFTNEEKDIDIYLDQIIAREITNISIDMGEQGSLIQLFDLDLLGDIYGEYLFSIKDDISLETSKLNPYFKNNGFPLSEKEHLDISNLENSDGKTMDNVLRIQDLINLVSYLVVKGKFNPDAPDDESIQVYKEKIRSESDIQKCEIDDINTFEEIITISGEDIDGFLMYNSRSAYSAAYDYSKSREDNDKIRYQQNQFTVGEYSSGYIQVKTHQDLEDTFSFDGILSANVDESLPGNEIIAYRQEGNKINVYIIDKGTFTITGCDRIVTANLDGDGDDIIAYDGKSITFYHNGLHPAISVYEFDDLAVGDVDGDGYDEIVTYIEADPGIIFSSKGKIRIYDWDPATNLLIPIGTSAEINEKEFPFNGIIIADLDDDPDHRSEIITYCEDKNTLDIYHCNEDESGNIKIIHNPNAHWQADGKEARFKSVRAGDINNDGCDELILFVPGAKGFFGIGAGAGIINCMNYDGNTISRIGFIDNNEEVEPFNDIIIGDFIGGGGQEIMTFSDSQDSLTCYSFENRFINPDTIEKKEYRFFDIGLGCDVSYSINFTNIYPDFNFSYETCLDTQISFAAGASLFHTLDRDKQLYIPQIEDEDMFYDYLVNPYTSFFNINLEIQNHTYSPLSAITGGCARIYLDGTMLGKYYHDSDQIINNKILFWNIPNGPHTFSVSIENDRASEYAIHRIENINQPSTFKIITQDKAIPSTLLKQILEMAGDDQTRENKLSSVIMYLAGLVNYPTPDQLQMRNIHEMNEVYGFIGKMRSDIEEKKFQPPEISYGIDYPSIAGVLDLLQANMLIYKGCLIEGGLKEFTDIRSAVDYSALIIQDNKISMSLSVYHSEKSLVDVNFRRGNDGKINGMSVRVAKEEYISSVLSYEDEGSAYSSRYVSDELYEEFRDYEIEDVYTPMDFLSVGITILSTVSKISKTMEDDNELMELEIGKDLIVGTINIVSTVCKVGGGELVKELPLENAEFLVIVIEGAFTFVETLEETGSLALAFVESIVSMLKEIIKTIVMKLLINLVMELVIQLAIHLAIVCAGSALGGFFLGIAVTLMACAAGGPPGWVVGAIVFVVSLIITFIFHFDEIMCLIQGKLTNEAINEFGGSISGFLQQNLETMATFNQMNMSAMIMTARARFGQALTFKKNALFSTDRTMARKLGNYADYEAANGKIGFEKVKIIKSLKFWSVAMWRQADDFCDIQQAPFENSEGFEYRHPMLWGLAGTDVHDYNFDIYKSENGDEEKLSQNNIKEFLTTVTMEDIRDKEIKIDYNLTKIEGTNIRKGNQEVDSDGIQDWQISFNTQVSQISYWYKRYSINSDKENYLSLTNDPTEYSEEHSLLSISKEENVNNLTVEVTSLSSSDGHFYTIENGEEVDHERLTIDMAGDENDSAIIIEPGLYFAKWDHGSSSGSEEHESFIYGTNTIPLENTKQTIMLYPYSSKKFGGRVNVNIDWSHITKFDIVSEFEGKVSVETRVLDHRGEIWQEGTFEIPEGRGNPGEPFRKTIEVPSREITYLDVGGKMLDTVKDKLEDAGVPAPMVMVGGALVAVMCAPYLLGVGLATYIANPRISTPVYVRIGLDVDGNGEYDTWNDETIRTKTVNYWLVFWEGEISVGNYEIRINSRYHPETNILGEITPDYDYAFALPDSNKIEDVDDAEIGHCSGVTYRIVETLKSDDVTDEEKKFKLEGLNEPPEEGQAVILKGMGFHSLPAELLMTFLDWIGIGWIIENNWLGLGTALGGVVEAVVEFIDYIAGLIWSGVLWVWDKITSFGSWLWDKLNPFSSDPPDSDEDGLPDEWEEEYGLNPKDDGIDNLETSSPNDGNVINGADGDPDGDGKTNKEEYEDKTDPTKDDDVGEPCFYPLYITKKSGFI